MGSCSSWCPSELFVEFPFGGDNVTAGEESEDEDVPAIFGKVGFSLDGLIPVCPLLTREKATAGEEDEEEDGEIEEAGDSCSIFSLS